MSTSSTRDQTLIPWTWGEADRPKPNAATPMIRRIVSAGRVILSGKFRDRANAAGLTVVHAARTLLAGSVQLSAEYCYGGWTYDLLSGGVSVTVAVTAQDELVLLSIKRLRRR